MLSHRPAASASCRRGNTGCWVLPAPGGGSRHLMPRSSRGAGSNRSRQRRQALRTHAGLFKDLFDFESWAPRSSQAWRLGNGNSLAEGRRAAQGSKDGIQQQDVDVLNQRLAAARAEAASSAPPSVGAAADEEEAATAAASGQDSDAEAAGFLRSTDEQLASALASRIAEVTSGEGGATDAQDGEALTGALLRELIYAKWGKSYDLSFVRRDLPLGKTLICLNVMWPHLEQRSFPMSEEEYEEKMDYIALLLNSWGQAERVQAFLREPPRARRGMPSKPTVGIAISIQLDLDDAMVNEYFAQGGA